MFQIQNRKRIQERDVRQAQILPLKKDQHFHISAESLEVHSDMTEALIDNTAVKSP